ncbi:hypothetical protein SCYAM73S_08032 [Streptomyces cyaneofuscatus]
MPVTRQLGALGIRLALTDDADFSGLSPRPLLISDVVQEAVLKVAEEGVEAAAVTVVAVAGGRHTHPAAHSSADDIGSAPAKGSRGAGRVPGSNAVHDL